MKDVGLVAEGHDGNRDLEILVISDSIPADGHP
jgi:hypothetical protein